MCFFVLHLSSLLKCLVSGIAHLVTHLKDSQDSEAVISTYGNELSQQQDPEQD